MEPLSIIASITGILMASTKVSSLLSQIQDAPSTIRGILAEVDHVRIVFTVLKRFTDESIQMRGSRASLIQLGDFIVILTQTALVFSELETLVAPLSSKGGLSGWRRLTWARQEPTALRLLNRLQRHEISLSLLLQIIQCHSNLQARQNAESLQQHIEREVDADLTLSARLEALELPLDAIELDSIRGIPYSEAEEPRVSESVTATARARAKQPDGVADTPTMVWQQGTMVTEPFEVVLSTTRVYDRVSNREIDEVFTISTARSYAWSMLSGLSLAQVSIIAVIKLPLSEAESRRFQQMVSLSAGEDLIEVPILPENDMDHHDVLYKLQDEVTSSIPNESSASSISNESGRPGGLECNVGLATTIQFPSLRSRVSQRDQLEENWDRQCLITAETDFNIISESLMLDLRRPFTKRAGLVLREIGGVTRFPLGVVFLTFTWQTYDYPKEAMYHDLFWVFPRDPSALFEVFLGKKWIQKNKLSSDALSSLPPGAFGDRM